MKNYLDILGIFPDIINSGLDLCENALRQAGLNEIELNDWLKETAVDISSISQSKHGEAVVDNLTYSILDMYFWQTAAILEEKGYQNVKYQIDIEGIHAHLYINGREFHKDDKLPKLVKAGAEV